MNVPAAGWNSTQSPRPSGDSPGRVVAIVLAVVSALPFILGLVFAGIGLASYLHVTRLVETALSAEGTVIELVRSEGENSSSWCPRVEFTDHHGEYHRFQLKVCSNPPRYREGERVDVVYTEDNPKNANINDVTLYLFGYIFGGIGGVFALLGGLGLAISFFVLKRSRKKARHASVT